MKKYFISGVVQAQEGGQIHTAHFCEVIEYPRIRTKEDLAGVEQIIRDMLKPVGISSEDTITITNYKRIWLWS